MALGTSTYIKGEKNPLKVTETVSQGTLSFSSPPTFSLWDAGGSIVSGYNAVAVSGYTLTPAASITAFFNFDTSALAAGYYYALFLLPISAQDGTARVKGFDFDLYVMPVPPV